MNSSAFFCMPTSSSPWISLKSSPGLNLLHRATPLPLQRRQRHWDKAGAQIIGRADLCAAVLPRQRQMFVQAVADESIAALFYQTKRSDGPRSWLRPRCDGSASQPEPALTRRRRKKNDRASTASRTVGSLAAIRWSRRNRSVHVRSRTLLTLAPAVHSDS